MLKNEILSEAFSIKGNYETNKISAVTKKIYAYLEELDYDDDDDVQLRDALCVLETYSNESLFKGSMYDVFGINKQVVTPVLNRIFGKKDWDIYDIRMSVRLLDYKP